MREREYKRNLVLEAHVEKFSNSRCSLNSISNNNNKYLHKHTHAQQNRVDLAENVAFCFYLFYLGRKTIFI